MRTPRASSTACARRVKTRAPCAARSRPRCGRPSTRPGSRRARNAPSRFTARNVARVRRMGEVPGAPRARRRARLDAARRGLSLHADRHLPRARRWRGADAAASGSPAKRRRRTVPHRRDHFPWSVLLRSLSAFEIFRRVSRDSVTPLRVLEFVVADARRRAALAASLCRARLREPAGRRQRAIRRDPAARGRAARAAALRHARELHGRRRRAPSSRASSGALPT